MKTLTLTKPITIDRRILTTAALAVLFVAVVAFIYLRFPMRHHWTTIFRPATLELLNFRSPYNVPDFYNPPWALLPIIPFALLPERLGWALYGAVTLFAFGFAARRMGASWLVTLVFLMLPHTLYNAAQVNVEWMVLLGFLLPPRAGLFLVLVKPQAGAFVALYWLIEAYRRGKAPEVARVFAPVTLAFAASFVLYGPWLARSANLILPEGKYFWPVSIPVGLALLFLSIRERKPGFALACAPLLAPYTQPYSWPVALLGLLPSNLWTLAVVASVWLAGGDSLRWMYDIIRAILPF